MPSAECGIGKAWTFTTTPLFRTPHSTLCIQMPGRLTVGQRPLKARMLVRFQPRQPLISVQSRVQSLKSKVANRNGLSPQQSNRPDDRAEGGQRFRPRFGSLGVTISNLIQTCVYTFSATCTWNLAKPGSRRPKRTSSCSRVTSIWVAKGAGGQETNFLANPLFTFWETTSSIGTNCRNLPGP